jgi:hypothetical protein
LRSLVDAEVRVVDAQLELMRFDLPERPAAHSLSEDVGLMSG